MTRTDGKSGSSKTPSRFEIGTTPASCSAAARTSARGTTPGGGVSNRTRSRSGFDRVRFRTEGGGAGADVEDRSTVAGLTCTRTFSGFGGDGAAAWEEGLGLASMEEALGLASIGSGSGWGSGDASRPRETRGNGILGSIARGSSMGPRSVTTAGCWTAGGRADVGCERRRMIPATALWPSRACTNACAVFPSQDCLHSRM
jgi:hypothetical protein